MAAKGKGKIEEYKKLFKELDKNGDGSLTIHELRGLFKRGGCKMSDRQVADTFVYFDGPRGDKSITLDEFIKGLEQIVLFVERCGELFRELDADGSGHLDKNELKILFGRCGKNFTDSEVGDILRQADKNCDNKISFEEFIDACT